MASSEEGTDANHFKSPVNHVIRRTGTDYLEELDTLMIEKFQRHPMAKVPA